MRHEEEAEDETQSNAASSSRPGSVSLGTTIIHDMGGTGTGTTVIHTGGTPNGTMIIHSGEMAGGTTVFHSGDTPKDTMVIHLGEGSTAPSPVRAAIAAAREGEGVGVTHAQTVVEASGTTTVLAGWKPPGGGLGSTGSPDPASLPTAVVGGPVAKDAAASPICGARGEPGLSIAPGSCLDLELLTPTGSPGGEGGGHQRPSLSTPLTPPRPEAASAELGEEEVGGGGALPAQRGLAFEGAWRGGAVDGQGRGVRFRQVFGDLERYELVELHELEASFKLLVPAPAGQAQGASHDSQAGSSVLSSPGETTVAAGGGEGGGGGRGGEGAGKGGAEEGELVDIELAVRLRRVDEELLAKVASLNRLFEEKKRLMRAAYGAGKGGRQLT